MEKNGSMYSAVSKTPILSPRHPAELIKADAAGCVLRMQPRRAPRPSRPVTTRNGNGFHFSKDKGLLGIIGRIKFTGKKMVFRLNSEFQGSI